MKLIVTIIALILLCSTQVTFADLSRAFGGTVMCGGNFFNRQSGTEAHRTVYNIRNPGPDDITIDRIRIYSATGGTALYDSNVTGFPTADNEVLSAADKILNPFQTAEFQISSLLDATLDATARPVQTIIDWSASARVLIPGFTTVRYVRVRGPGIGTLFESRSRGHTDCRNTVLNQGRFISNIPNSTISDQPFIRVYNRSSVTGSVKGTLTGQDGSVIFTDQVLIASLAPGQVVVLKVADLEGIAGTWVKRAHMTVTSTIPDIEVVPLIRASIGTLHNMSGTAK